MRNARLGLRAAALALVTFLLALFLVLGLPGAALVARTLPWRVTLARLWAKACVRLLGMKVVSEGDAPAGAFLLVSNHLSYIDIILLLSTVRAVFVSKADVAAWPVLGPLARLAGTLFIERQKKKDVLRVSGEIRRILERGMGIILFPEGTSTAGAEVHAFRSSLLEPAASLSLPVRYASIRYSTPAGEPPAHLAVSWWGEMAFGPHVRDLLRLSGFGARIVFGAESIEDPDRKSLARRLHRAVASRFVPML